MKPEDFALTEDIPWFVPYIRIAEAIIDGLEHIHRHSQSGEPYAFNFGAGIYPVFHEYFILDREKGDLITQGILYCLTDMVSAYNNDLSQIFATRKGVELILAGHFWVFLKQRGIELERRHGKVN